MGEAVYKTPISPEINMFLQLFLNWKNNPQNSAATNPPQKEREAKKKVPLIIPRALKNLSCGGH